MDNISQRLNAYIDAHPFAPGDSNYDTVLDQLYHAYQESHEKMTLLKSGTASGNWITC